MCMFDQYSALFSEIVQMKQAFHCQLSSKKHLHVFSLLANIFFSQMISLNILAQSSLTEVVLKFEYVHLTTSKYVWNVLAEWPTVLTKIKLLWRSSLIWVCFICACLSEYLG